MSAVWKEGPPFQRKKTRNSTWSRKPITFFAKLHGYILHMYYIGRLLPILCSQFELWILAFELKVNLQLWSWMLIRIENKKICAKNINYVYKIFFSVLGRPFVMAACLKNGDILLLRSYDDVIPQVSTAIYFSCKIYLRLTLG